MRYLKIVSIVGARPQFVKAAMVSRALRSYSEIKEIIVHTGQHFDHNMSNVFFSELNIPEPHYHLGVHSLSHAGMTGKMMEKIEKVLEKEQPDWVLVYGDTNSTLAGSLTAKKMKIKVAHVEAGLRSYNMDMPEEVNRILTDRISDLLFCPTDKAVRNLQKEGYGLFDAEIVQVGDVMLDAVHFYKNHRKRPPYDLPGHFSLCTLHRAENTDQKENLNGIMNALTQIAKNNPVVFPIHPRTKQKLEELEFSLSDSSIYFIPPVSYLEMLWLLSEADIVLTDSGGLQKEACFCSKFCITLREETEWTELVEGKCNFLAGSSSAKIKKYFDLYIGKPFDTQLAAPYGDGNAADKIARTLLTKWTLS